MSSFDEYELWRAKFDSDDQAAREAYAMLIMRSFEVFYLRCRLKQARQYAEGILRKIRSQERDREVKK